MKREFINKDKKYKENKEEAEETGETEEREGKEDREDREVIEDKENLTEEIKIINKEGNSPHQFSSLKT